MNLESSGLITMSGGIGGSAALSRDSTVFSDVAPLVQCLKETHKW